MIRVVKIGGNVIDSESALKAFCADFAALPGPKLLVHGGGVLASSLQEALGQKPVMIEGRRVTDEAALRSVTMVYAGWCNKHIVALLQAQGCNAIGLSGADANLIRCPRRQPRTLSDGQTVVDYGFVGDVCKESVNVEMLQGLLALGLCPVVCAINHDGSGQLLNTNADTVASSLASALGAELVCLFEKKGVLLNSEDEDSVIESIDTLSFERLREEGVIVKGMIPKIENALKSLREGAVGVVIKNSAALLDEGGTKIKL